MPASIPTSSQRSSVAQFAIRAFESEAPDYLVKPVSEAPFAATMKRVRRRLRAAAAPPSREPGIVVTTSGGALVLRVAEIDWIEAADNYARIWTGGRSYLLRESLRELQARVGGHGFIRAHRRALVRLAGVRALEWTDEGGLVAVLASSVRIRVSRRRRAAFAASVRQRA